MDLKAHEIICLKRDGISFTTTTKWVDIAMSNSVLSRLESTPHFGPPYFYQITKSRYSFKHEPETDPLAIMLCDLMPSANIEVAPSWALPAIGHPGKKVLVIRDPRDRDMLIESSLIDITGITMEWIFTDLAGVHHIGNPNRHMPDYSSIIFRRTRMEGMEDKHIFRTMVNLTSVSDHETPLFEYMQERIPHLALEPDEDQMRMRFVINDTDYVMLKLLLG